jgi:hypothetical protein
MPLAAKITSNNALCFGDFLDSIAFYDLSVLSGATYDAWWAQVNAGGTNIAVYDYNGARRDAGTPLFFSKVNKTGIIVFCADTTSSIGLDYKIVAGITNVNGIESVLSKNSIIMFLDTTVASGDIVDKTNRALNWETYGLLSQVLYRQTGPLGVSLGLGRGAAYTTSGNIRSKINDTFNRDYNQQHSFLCMTKRYAYASKEELIFKTSIAGGAAGVWFEYGTNGALNAYIQNNSSTNNNSLYSAAGVGSNTNWHVAGYSYAGTGIATDCRMFYDGGISNTVAANTLSATIISGGPAMIGFDTTGNLGPDAWFSFPMLFSKQIFGDQVKTLSNQMLSNSTFWTLGGVSNFSTGGGQSRLGIGFPRIGL